MPTHFVQPVHRATHRIGLYLDDLREPGLTQGEAHILAMLDQAGTAKIADLHRGLAHKRSTLTSILDRLTARGLVTREVSSADRRTFVVKLTAQGRTVARRVGRHLSALEQSISKRATPAEIKGFQKVVAILEEEAHRRTSR